MFKLKKLNRQYVNTPSSISSVVGSAFHAAMEAYYDVQHTTDSDAIVAALSTGGAYIDEYPEGFIQYIKTIPTRQHAHEKLAFALSSYTTEFPRDTANILLMEERLEHVIDSPWRATHIQSPIPLVGVVDKVVRTPKGITIVDYKTAYAFSNPEKIDGGKILQAIHYYFLCLMEFGEEPYSFEFHEVKTSKNKGGGSQVMVYEIIYEQHETYFDFYLRFFADMITALSGEQVYVPNISAMYDNDIAMVSYIYRLDEDEVRAKLMQEHQVHTISELLQKKLQDAGKLDALLQSLEKSLATNITINYNDMPTEQKIQTKLMEHGVLVSYHDTITGPSVVLYRFTPSIGVKMSKVLSYSADIEQAIGETGVRILAPIPGTTFVGVEVPVQQRTFSNLPPLLNNGLEVHIGTSIMGEAITYDLKEAPHMLVAGASGSGKSVFLNSIIAQLIPTAQLWLFDPKIVELLPYKGQAHVYQSDVEEIHDHLEYLTLLMNERYEKYAQAGVRNIDEYNTKQKDSADPYIVVVIDEFGDLIISDHKRSGERARKSTRVGSTGTISTATVITETEENLSENIMKFVLMLAQKARAAGIHMIITTQRPSTDVIKGSIKANFPVKVLFRTSKAIDSQVVIDESGAEKLLGKGDMLFSTERGITRLQGYSI